MAPLVPTLAREAAAWAQGQLLVGVDEVGRGPLAGPVVAAAVVFPAGCPCIEGLRDSKTLPANARQTLAAAIRAAALAIGLGAASAAEIDRLNIRIASAVAMRRALGRVLPRVGTACVLIDGLPLPELGLTHDALVDGDALCHSVAAAGVVAKTVRDALMHRLAVRHPGYGWETNVGYGTDAHHAGLAALGATPHHRRSFAPVAQLFLTL
ncbi:MAG TPA: ribonuclease HII [Gemmatimonadales bacterium]|nr:ribonuclease HII [Gemmatimonadales bacterium]